MPLKKKKSRESRGGSTRETRVEPAVTVKKSDKHSSDKHSSDKHASKKRAARSHVSPSGSAERSGTSRRFEAPVTAAVTAVVPVAETFKSCPPTGVLNVHEKLVLARSLPCTDDMPSRVEEAAKKWEAFVPAPPHLQKPNSRVLVNIKNRETGYDQDLVPETVWVRKIEGDGRIVVATNHDVTGQASDKGRILNEPERMVLGQPSYLPSVTQSKKIEKLAQEYTTTSMKGLLKDLSKSQVDFSSEVRTSKDVIVYEDPDAVYLLLKDKTAIDRAQEMSKSKPESNDLRNKNVGRGISDERVKPFLPSRALNKPQKPEKTGRSEEKNQPYEVHQPKPAKVEAHQPKPAKVESEKPARSHETPAKSQETPVVQKSESRPLTATKSESRPGSSTAPVTADSRPTSPSSGAKSILSTRSLESVGSKKSVTSSIENLVGGLKKRVSSTVLSTTGSMKRKLSIMSTSAEKLVGNVKRKVSGTIGSVKRKVSDTALAVVGKGKKKKIKK